MGANLSLVVRDGARGDEALREIRGVPGVGDVDLFVADLSLMSDIRRVAGEIAARHPAIDVLINNAGGIFGERAMTPEGLERTFATNHVGYFLLTRLLLDALRAAPKARVVSVASSAHLAASGVAFDDLTRSRGYAGLGVYAESKLMNILFASELARRLARDPLSSRITSNSLHPGTIASNFSLDGGGITKAFFVALRPFLASEASGARTTVFLASSPDVDGVTGKYFARCREKKPSAAARDEAMAKRLWDVTSEICGIPAN